MTDANGDVFGTAQTVAPNGDVLTETVFELPYADGSYAATPTVLFSLPNSAATPPGLFDLPNSAVAPGLISGLALDQSGNLFGASAATVAGAASVSGTIYEDPLVNGAYAAAPSVLATVPGFAGVAGVASDLVTDGNGDLFGTLSGDAETQTDGPAEDVDTATPEGVVFELPRTADGYATTATVLASFTGASTTLGANAAAQNLSALVTDANGDLFGVSGTGGANGTGYVFEIARTATGYASAPTVLDSFDAVGGAVSGFYQGDNSILDPGPDTSTPSALTMDAAGDLFGVTPNTVFEIAKTSTGYSASATSIASPGFLGGRLAVDAAGDLYGETPGYSYRRQLPTELPQYAFMAGTVFEIPETASGYASAATTLAGIYAPTDGLQFTPTGGLLGADITAGLFTIQLSPSATIAGADGVTRTLDFGSTAVAALAVPALGGVSTAAALFVDAAGAATLAAGQTAAIDDVATGTVSLTGNAAANESIVAATGNFRFTGGAGSGTVLAGSGSNLIDLEGGGNWNVAVGNGANAIIAAAGNDTVSTGSGASLVYFGSGAGSLASGGADTINGGTGSDTISATSSNPDLVIDAKGSLTFLAGTGASTVVAGQVATTIVGGASGGTLAFGNVARFSSARRRTRTLSPASNMPAPPSTRSAACPAA